MHPQHPQIPDYSKVQSKVKKYIDAVKEQQQEKRAGREGRTVLSPPPPPPPEDTCQHIRRLEHQLAERDVQVSVLQGEHDRLLLQMARLKNMLDEMRVKATPAPAAAAGRRTNSPPSPVDIQNSQLKMAFVSGTDSPDSPTLSALTSYRDLATPSPGHQDDDATSTDAVSSSNWTTSIRMEEPSIQSIC